ncbi:MmgE/PrpD family protein [Micromonospora echinofusca]|uniref:MmgE/PrpD family protein n=1 Tax=Micromonospora echinofusca TaxID=47858 RepID=A0ABS3VMA0_MICEH|nr:MmgE/PrpD family protein [Micromonospora echinofusca]MBO4205666.1 MmgE/PrpD family protein [Micromonospora echinofusca]
MTEPTLGQRLAAFAADTPADTLPDEVVASVQARVLDIIGLCVAALPLPTSQAALAYVTEQGGRGQATVVGLAEQVPAALAAFANGVLAHSLDYDDTHLPSVLHPSASVVPAALAAAELAGASGRETVAAIAVGLEVCVRLGMAGYDPVAGNSVFFEHGQHATSICGTLGGAVAAARLLGLDAGGTLDALGVAASMAAGLIESNRNGGTVKRIHCGWAAHSAVSAALLARHGVTGPPTVLEGRFGFFQAFLRGEFDADEIVRGLGTEWTVPGIFFKPYPANHFTHAAIDAAMALREQGLPVDRIESITLGVPAPVIRTIGQPIERKRTPQTGYEAQFSGPYAVAAGLCGGGGLGVGLADFTDDLARDPARRALMARVEVVADERCDAIFPNQFPAVLRVVTGDGREWTSEVLANRGGPQRPLSEAELAVKFRSNAAAGLSAETAARIEEEVRRMDRAPDVRRLTDLIAREGTTDPASVAQNS